MSPRVQVGRAAKLAGGFCILHLMGGREPTRNIPGLQRTGVQDGLVWGLRKTMWDLEVNESAYVTSVRRCYAMLSLLFHRLIEERDGEKVNNENQGLKPLHCTKYRGTILLGNIQQRSHSR